MLTIIVHIFQRLISLMFVSDVYGLLVLSQMARYL